MIKLNELNDLDKKAFGTEKVYEFLKMNEGLAFSRKDLINDFLNGISSVEYFYILMARTMKKYPKIKVRKIGTKAYYYYEKE